MRDHVNVTRAVAIRVFLTGFLGASLLGTAMAEGSPIPVGNGNSHAEVTVEFVDGTFYVFEVSFDGQTTGLGLLDVIETSTTLTTIRNDFGWGVFVDGISYEGHSNMGYGGGENWWHYWIKDPGGNWQSPSYGASSRTVIDGCSDAWIYGRAGMPIPEPATVLLAALATTLVLKRSVRVG